MEFLRYFDNDLVVYRNQESNSTPRLGTSQHLPDINQPVLHDIGRGALDQIIHGTIREGGFEGISPTKRTPDFSFQRRFSNQLGHKLLDTRQFGFIPSHELLRRCLLYTSDA